MSHLLLCLSAALRNRLIQTDCRRRGVESVVIRLAPEHAALASLDSVYQSLPAVRRSRRLVVTFCLSLSELPHHTKNERGCCKSEGVFVVKRRQAEKKGQQVSRGTEKIDETSIRMRISTGVPILVSFLTSPPLALQTKWQLFHTGPAKNEVQIASERRSSSLG